MSLPYQAVLNPDPGIAPDDWRGALSGHVFRPASWSGLESGLYVLRPGEYDIESVHDKHKPRIQRGL
jgi:hypothetical protein